MKIQMQNVGCLSTGMLATGLVALMAGSAGAAPIAIAQAEFSGSETVIDFNGLAPGTPITTQYSAQGVTFSGGLTANFASQGQNFALFTFTGSPITIDFSSTMLRAGFDVRNNDLDNLFVNVQAFSGGTLVSTGVLEFQTGTSFSFAGIEDSMDGIDRLVLSAAGGERHQRVLDGQLPLRGSGDSGALGRAALSDRSDSRGVEHPATPPIRVRRDAGPADEAGPGLRAFLF